MRWVLGLFVLLAIVAALVIADRASEGPPDRPAGAAEPLAAPAPEPVPPAERAPAPEAPGEVDGAGVRKAPAGATAEPRLETGPDGRVTITNIPDDPTAPRLVQEPDGGLLITNQPEP